MVEGLLQWESVLVLQRDRVLPLQVSCSLIGLYYLHLEAEPSQTCFEAYLLCRDRRQRCVLFQKWDIMFLRLNDQIFSRLGDVKVMVVFALIQTCRFA